MIASLRLGRIEKHLSWPTSTAKGTNTQTLQKVSEKSDMEKISVIWSVAFYHADVGSSFLRSGGHWSSEYVASSIKKQGGLWSPSVESQNREVCRHRR